jgi:hypothetical protein
MMKGALLLYRWYQDLCSSQLVHPTHCHARLISSTAPTVRAIFVTSSSAESWPTLQGLHPKHGGPSITISTVVNLTHLFSGSSGYHYFAIFATNMRLTKYGVINPAMPRHKCD